MIVFSFDMLNIKMILNEQNVMCRLSLIDRNNVKVVRDPCQKITECLKKVRVIFIYCLKT